jgi:hypothetical protein
MATLDKLGRLVMAAGGKLVGESSGRWHVSQCEAPAGKVWAASSTHALRVEWRHGDSKGRDEAVADAIERVEEGVTDCDDEECDYCHPG